MTSRGIRAVVTGCVLTAALMVAPALPAGAAVVCTEPLEPICTGNDATYESGPLVERCKSDVKKFLEETDAYIACLEDQASAKREEAEQLAREFRERTGETID